ncbi:MAG: DUF6768 family protein [Phycisphaerae bacterium]|jgi:hypothetical protein
MVDFENELKNALEKNGVFDIAKSETARKETVQMFDDNMRKVKIVYWICILLCLGMMGTGYIGLRSAADTRDMLLCVILFMIGFNSTILMKLWYWVVSSKYKVLEEIKRLQLQIAEQVGKKG